MLIRIPKIDHESLYARVQAKYQCSHSKTEIRRKTITGGGQMIRAQCLACGASVGSARKKSEFSAAQIASMPVWDEELKKRFWASHAEDMKRLNEGAQEAAISQFRAEYDTYLRSDAWKKKAEAVMLRAQGICEGCRSARATQVHHLTYAHCGEEFLFELVAVCRPCHERLHLDDEVEAITSDPSVKSMRDDASDEEEDCPF